MQPQQLRRPNKALSPRHGVHLPLRRSAPESEGPNTCNREATVLKQLLDTVASMPLPLLVNFIGGTEGPWRVTSQKAVAGPELSTVPFVRVVEGRVLARPLAGWALQGVTSNERYVERGERVALSNRQEPLGRPDATCAALIPITKSPAWWDLTQDERRAILETRSRHIAIGLEYLPKIARRLHHGRDIRAEFDFLTWFEFPPDATEEFEDLVGRLRSTEEWTYVKREVDIRLVRQ